MDLETPVSYPRQLDHILGNTAHSCLLKYTVAALKLL